MNRLNNIVVIIFFFMVAPLNAQQLQVNAQQLQEQKNIDNLPSLVDARISNINDRTRLVLDLNATTLFAIVSLDNPLRIGIDIQASKIDLKKATILTGEGLINSVSIEQASKDRIRTWLFLSKPAKVLQAYVLEAFENQPARLVVDIVPATKGQFEKNVALDLAYSQKLQENTATQNASNTNIVSNSELANELESTVSQRPLIIIDPGHGGIDGGAQSKSGHKEKEIVLTFALSLQKTLIKTGKYDVALTRNDDIFVSLNQRVNLARSNKADLFISIHADSFDQASVGGASIYFRDEEASDELDKILAENENRVDIISGLVPPNLDSNATNILVDIMRREMRKKAYRVSSIIIDQLKPSIKMRRFPLRKADFYVLQSPDVPSILIELGFLSNEKDAKNFETTNWSERASDAIARGIAIYFKDNNFDAKL